MRSARSKDPIDALDLLRSQHGEVDRLISQLARSEGGHKEEVFAELADKLAAHATIEERLFHPAARARQAEDLPLEPVEHHLRIKRLLADMLDLDCEDDAFDAKLAVLEEEVRRHAREEEERFPTVRARFDAEELTALGGEMLALFVQLLLTEPRHRVPAETDEAARI